MTFKKARQKLLTPRSLGRLALRLEGLEERRLLSVTADDLVEESAENAGAQTTDTFEQRTDENTPAIMGSLIQSGSLEDLRDRLMDQAVQQWSWTLGETLDYPPWWSGAPGDVLFRDAVSPGDFNGAEGGVSHSDTNVQEAGVDEGDIVETDGDHIYVLSGNELLIFDALPANETQIVSRTKLDFMGGEMYLDGDRLVVIGQPAFFYTDFRGGPFIDAILPPWGGYYEPETQVTVLDVSDRAAPSTVQDLTLEGSYHTSRSIDGNVHLVMQNGFDFPVPLFEEIQVEVEKPTRRDPDIGVPEDDGESETFLATKYVVESEEAYRARIVNTIVEDVLPSYTATLPGDEDATKEGLFTEPTDIFTSDDPNDHLFVSVVVVDAHSDEPGLADATTLMTSHSSGVYASRDNLYITTQEWRPVAGERGEHTEVTSIVKVAMGEDGVEPVATGEVRGRLLNQFSMSEHDGYFRVATTEGWGLDASNHVFVLEDQAGELTTVGSVTDLAPGERVFSARFVGERAFVVTFRQVDPLFTLDLSDPTAPSVEGELKLPGFSNYLQAIDENLLLGIGRDADPETGRAQELQISLFDVSDLSQPRVVDQFSFDDENWSWTEATYDPQAVAYFPEFETLAIPVTSGWEIVEIDADGDGVEDSRHSVPRSALWVFDVNASGIDLAGTIGHESEMRRGVRVNGNIYSISNDALQVHSLDNLDEPLAEVSFGRDFVGIQVNPHDPARGDLLILGTASTDTMQIRPTDDGMVAVDVNGQTRGEFPAESIQRIVADGRNGEDQILFRDRGQIGADLDTSLDAELEVELGDIDGNGQVGLSDFTLLKSHFGRSGPNLVGDLDGDGDVDIEDFRVLKSNMGERTPTRTAGPNVDRFPPNVVFLPGFAVEPIAIDAAVPAVAFQRALENEEDSSDELEAVDAVFASGE